MNEKIEKFTSADVYADGNNDTLVDEGYFTPNGFHSILLTIHSPDTDCDCQNRKEHESHLRDIL